MVWLRALGIAWLLALAGWGCASDDDADDDAAADDDNDDDTGDDDDDNDDDNNDDNDNDNDDDDNDNNDDNDTFADDYVAPWPQEVVEPADYDESPAPGPRREKAMAYDDWHLTWHQPDHGSCVHCYFADETYAEVTGYHGLGDSTIWTGTYLGTQALRYHVTGDPEAKQNAINKVHTLSGHLHVTGRTGFISRFWGSQAMMDFYGGDDWCDTYDRCHRVNDGPYAGDFWLGETSRDQYTGWFYGMALAYDLVDDEPTRAIVRADVAEVLNALIDQNWWIIDEAGQPTDAGPNVLPPMQLSWLAVGYHVTGDERFRAELADRLRDSWRPILRLDTIAFFNRYGDYFGNNLSHTNWYTLLRLARAYVSPADYAFLLRVFETQVHTFTRLSHNPWFNSVFMGEGDYTPARDEHQAQLEEDLLTFRPPPLGEYYLPAREPGTYTLDPVSVFLHDLEEQFPFLEELLGTIDYQALEPFTVDLQCTAGFMFQWSPFQIDECGADNPTKVQSGHDYLAAYWLASFHGFLRKDQ